MLVYSNQYARATAPVNGVIVRPYSDARQPYFKALRNDSCIIGLEYLNSYGSIV